MQNPALIYASFTTKFSNTTLGMSTLAQLLAPNPLRIKVWITNQSANQTNIGPDATTLTSKGIILLADNTTGNQIQLSLLTGDMWVGGAIYAISAGISTTLTTIETLYNGQEAGS
jgi:hypothetical protein